MDMKLGKFTLISVTKEVGKFHCCQNFVWAYSDGHCGSPSPPLVYEDRLFSSEAYVPEFKQGKKAVSVPFPGLSKYLRPETPEEVQVEPLLSRSNLLITRDIEWANLVLGFEQENRATNQLILLIDKVPWLIGGEGVRTELSLPNVEKIMGSVSELTEDEAEDRLQDAIQEKFVVFGDVCAFDDN